MEDPHQRPLRSLLFVPGNRSAWFEPALRSGADGLIIDLQDAVPPSEREPAYAAFSAFLQGLDPATHPVVLVRIRAVSDPGFLEDLSHVVRPGVDGIVLPMVDTVDDVLELVRHLDEAEQRLAMTRRLLVAPLLETAAAVMRCYEIFSCSDRVAYGGGATARGGDLARAVGFQWTPEGLETLYLRSHALLAARAAGIRNPISGMWGTVADTAGLRAFALQTRGLGYRGMMVIHPSHVPVVNEVFSPTPAEVAGWQRVIDRLEQLHGRGLGTGTIDGDLIDSAHAATAREELERARELGLL